MLELVDKYTFWNTTYNLFPNNIKSWRTLQSKLQVSGKEPAKCMEEGQNEQSKNSKESMTERYSMEAMSFILWTGGHLKPKNRHPMITEELDEGNERFILFGGKI